MWTAIQSQHGKQAFNNIQQIVFWIFSVRVYFVFSPKWTLAVHTREVTDNTHTYHGATKAERGSGMSLHAMLSSAAVKRACNLALKPGRGSSLNPTIFVLV